jgi:hypothetical protein
MAWLSLSSLATVIHGKERVRALCAAGGFAGDGALTVVGYGGTRANFGKTRAHQQLLLPAGS